MNEEKRQYLKQYYKDNADKIKEKEKEYYRKNKEKILEKNKKYNMNNSKKLKQYAKKYYEKNTEKIIQKRKENYYKHREEKLKKAKEYYQRNKEKNRYKNDSQTIKKVKPVIPSEAKCVITLNNEYIEYPIYGSKEIMKHYTTPEIRGAFIYSYGSARRIRKYYKSAGVDAKIFLLRKKKK